MVTEIETLDYKGFTAKVFFEDGIFRGKIENIPGLVTFKNSDCKELEKEFRAIVDNCLELRREIKRLNQD